MECRPGFDGSGGGCRCVSVFGDSRTGEVGAEYGDVFVVGVYKQQRYHFVGVVVHPVFYVGEEGEEGTAVQECAGCVAEFECAV